MPSCEFGIKCITLQVDSFLVACLLYCELNTVFQLIIYTKWMKEDNKYSKKVPKERLLFVMSPQTPLKKGLIL